MSTQTDKLRQAIERAMARIGCPPGDNSDADLYRELQSALSELEARPSQTDEQLYKQAMDDVTPEALSRMDKRLAAIDAQTENLIPVRQAVRIVQQWIVDRALVAQAEAQEAQVNRFVCDNGDSIELVGHAGGAAAEGLYSFVICNVVEGGTARTVTYYREAQAGDGERYPTMKEYTERMADKFAHELAASQAIGEQTPVATNPIIGNARQRWKELGNDDPERVAERYRGDPWRIFYTGWTEGRAPLVIQLNDNHRLFTEARDSLAEYRDTYRSPLSPEARDKAIHALQVSRITHKAMCREDHVDMIDDALSALRGQ